MVGSATTEQTHGNDTHNMSTDHPASKISLYAWVGQDEFTNKINFGIKQGIVPVRGSPHPMDCVPLVSIAKERMLDRGIPEAMKDQAVLYKKTIYLCRYVFAEEIKVIAP